MVIQKIKKNLGKHKILEENQLYKEGHKFHS